MVEKKFSVKNYDESIIPKPQWSPGIGYVTYKRTYARAGEEFSDTLDRVINAMNDQLHCGFSRNEQVEVARLLSQFKCLIAGRMLWQLGTTTVDRYGLLSLQNCAATRIDEPVIDIPWVFDVLLLGCGVGVNIEDSAAIGQRVFPAKVTILNNSDADYIVPDTREGWVESARRLMESHFLSADKLHGRQRDFSMSTMLLRPKGTPIKGFGGEASGPEALEECILNINRVLNDAAIENSDGLLTSISLLDVINMIGQTITSAARRSALLLAGSPHDDAFLKAKRFDLGAPFHRTTSNNSVITDDINILPEAFWETYNSNVGEPMGILNRNLAQQIGRKNGETPLREDSLVICTNPCLPGNAVIMTPMGPRRMDDIVEYTNPPNRMDTVKLYGGNVLVHGGTHPVTRAIMTRKEGDKRTKMVNVVTHPGFEVVCTEDHQILTRRIGKMVFVKACELNRNEEIVLNSGHPSLSWDTPARRGLRSLNEKSDGFLFGMLFCGMVSPWHIGKAPMTLAFPPKTKLSLDYFADLWSNYTELPPTVDEVVRDIEVATSSTFQQGFLVALFHYIGNFDYHTYNLEFTFNEKKPRSLLCCIQRMLFYRGVFTVISQDNTKISPMRTRDVDVMFYLASSIVKMYHDMRPQSEVDNPSPHIFNHTQLFTTVSHVTPIPGYAPALYDLAVARVNSYGANCIVVKNCGEQWLEKFETCCLGEIILPNNESLEEFRRSVELIYRVCKHSLMLKCHWPQTQEVVHRNMRMGIGITGCDEATEEQKSWLPIVSAWLRDYDVEYSQRLGVPTSIRLCTIKPSGTLSVLAGVKTKSGDIVTCTNGIHKPYSEYLLKRMRVKNSGGLKMIVEEARRRGYRVEPLLKVDFTESGGIVQTPDPSIMVIDFPLHYKNVNDDDDDDDDKERPMKRLKTAENTSAIEQLETVRRYQRDWSDNSVSCTVTYRPHEIPEIKEYLKKYFKSDIKAVSFLLHSGHGFLQAPWEPMTREEYEEYTKRIDPFTDGSLASLQLDENEDNIDTSMECKNGFCPIR